MEQTRKRKILIGVLGVGLTALVCDRFVLGPPSEAHAAATSVAQAIEEQAPSAASSATLPAARPPASVTDRAALPDYTGLAQRLQRLQRETAEPPPATGRDLFAEPADWAPKAVTREPEPEARGPIADPQAFLAQYRLESIQIQSVSDTRKVTVATINGESYLEGDTLETFVLRGWTDNPTDGRGAVWESQKTGQMFVMRVSR